MNSHFFTHRVTLFSHQLTLLLCNQLISNDYLEVKRSLKRKIKKILKKVKAVDKGIESQIPIKIIWLIKISFPTHVEKLRTASSPQLSHNRSAYNRDNCVLRSALNNFFVLYKKQSKDNRL